MPSGHTERATINTRRPLTDNMRLVLQTIVRFGDVTVNVLSQEERNAARALLHRGLLEWHDRNPRGFYAVTDAGRSVAAGTSPELDKALKILMRPTPAVAPADTPADAWPRCPLQTSWSWTHPDGRAVDPTAQTEPLTKGQQIVAHYETDTIAEPCELAEAIDRAVWEASNPPPAAEPAPAGETPLSVWVAAEKARLDEFAAWWALGKSGEQSEMFPSSMPDGEWDDQYRGWTGG